jgi:hypothetical protein
MKIQVAGANVWVSSPKGTTLPFFQAKPWRCFTRTKHKFCLLPPWSSKTGPGIIGKTVGFGRNAQPVFIQFAVPVQVVKTADSITPGRNSLDNNFEASSCLNGNYFLVARAISLKEIFLFIKNGYEQPAGWLLQIGKDNAEFSAFHYK